MFSTVSQSAKKFGTKTYPDCYDNHNIDQEIQSQGNIF